MKKILRILCCMICFLYGFSSVQAWPVLSIKKDPDQDLNYKQMPAAVLNIETTKEKQRPICSWPEKATSFFPDCDKTYQIRLDLKGFDTGHLLYLSAFLEKISNDSDLKKRVALLILTNGTSYKFNKLFPGIKSFFDNIEKAEIFYAHSGDQKPTSPATNLHSLSPETFENIFEKISKNSKDSVSSDFSTNTSMVKIGKYASKISKSKSPQILKDLIQKGTFQEYRDDLERRWKEVGERKADLFLGLKKYSQYKKIHYDSLSDTIETPENIIFLEVGGMRYGGGKTLVEFCQKLPHLRAIRICNSYSSPDDLIELCQAKITRASSHMASQDISESSQAEFDDENLDLESTQALLSNKGVFFVDIETAGIKGGTKKFKKNLKKQGFSSFVPYFLWVPSIWSHEEDFTSLSNAHQRRHQLFWIFCNYLTLLEQEFCYNYEKIWNKR